MVHKNKNSYLYQNAKLLMKAANELKETKKYHRFGVLLRELDGEGIVFDESAVDLSVDQDMLNEQISLLWQCMFFNYVLV